MARAVNAKHYPFVCIGKGVLLLMEDNRKTQIKNELLVFFAIVALTGLAMGMSDSVISNFFKDAYDVTAVQRGFLELPREGPGVLLFLIIAFTSAIGDVRLAIISQALCAIGAFALGIHTPSFAVMSIYVFINSLGMHVYIPLQDSIGMSIIGQDQFGKVMGQYTAVRTACTMLASILVFFGFRMGFFSFKTPIKLPFLIGAVGFLGVLALYVLLYTKYKVYGQARKTQFQIVIKKEYTLYYCLAVLTGIHRQIMVVFGPWVLIELLSQQADTLAMLGIISALVGAACLPVIGRWIDRFGAKVVLLAEALAFFFVYIIYGLLSGGFMDGSMATVGIPVLIVCVLFVLDRFAMQIGMARTVYLRTIATDPADITPTISAGLSMDHVVSITCAYMGGVVWNGLGPQYVFYIGALVALVNVGVTLLMKSVSAASAV